MLRVGVIGLGVGEQHVQAWERLMWEFQQPLPWAAPGEKWVAMERIYELGAQ